MTIFSRIIAGEIPCYKVEEDEKYFAFLDISPLAKGHTLVIPKREVDYIFDLTDEEIAGLQVFAKKVAVAIKKAIPCVKVGQCVLGLEVPHAHIHLVPMQSEADLRFTNPRVELSAEEFEEIAKSIRVLMLFALICFCLEGFVSETLSGVYVSESGVLFNELTTRAYILAHKHGEYIVGAGGIFYSYLFKQAGFRVHGGFPQLGGVHFTKTFVALCGNAVFASVVILLQEAQAV